ncbi:MAG: hypothetical protein IJP29_02595 [Lachnospiraceae bacterium]|nr:hypothetical protein [Lachnospiraceae bacterium]
MMDNMKKWFLIVFALMGICSFSHMVQAENLSDFSNGSIMIYDDATLEDGKTTIRWNAIALPTGSSATFSFDVELADNRQFIDAEQYSTNMTALTIEQSAFGDHGGRFYVRVRVVMHTTGEDATTTAGDWCTPAEMVYIKINKNNFPGMYKVLKNGGKYNSSNGVKKIDYDQNGDGWLDPEEINDIWMLGTLNITKKVNGVYKTTKAPDVSSFKGIEYFTNLNSVHIARYSGKTADLSKCPARWVDIRGITAKQFTLNAPNAKDVIVEASHDTKMTKLDVSKCKNVIDLTAYGNNGTKTLKLPKNKKKLKVLSVSEIGAKSLNLNAYTKLQQLYVYDCDVKSVKVNKCKNLRYIYFWYCDNIKSLNLKSNTKLRGADFYKTPGLTATTVKKSKSGKYTWNKGKWWYGTSAYKKDMKKLYQ